MLHWLQVRAMSDNDKVIFYNRANREVAILCNHQVCLLLSALVCSCLLLSALFCSCLLLSAHVCICRLLSALVCIYLLLSALVCFLLSAVYLLFDVHVLPAVYTHAHTHTHTPLQRTVPKGYDDQMGKMEGKLAEYEKSIEDLKKHSTKLKSNRSTSNSRAPLQHQRNATVKLL
jgi:hypothetical protein